MCASTRKVMAWKSLLIPRRRHMMQTFVPQTVGASRLRSPRQQHISANIFCNGKIFSWMKCVINRNIFCLILLVVGGISRLNKQRFAIFSQSLRSFII